MVCGFAGGDGRDRTAAIHKLAFVLIGADDHCGRFPHCARFLHSRLSANNG
jgi:hypothetical protein